MKTFAFTIDSSCSLEQVDVNCLIYTPTSYSGVAIWVGGGRVVEAGTVM